MTSRRFADAWGTYARDVLPKEAPEVQRIECRHAFYARGVALFHTILNAVSPGEEVNDADMALLDGIKAEFDDYAREIGELAKKGSPAT